MEGDGCDWKRERGLRTPRWNLVKRRLVSVAFMTLPETDLARIKKWCDSIWPEHMWDQAKVEANLGPTHVTIVEVRPGWMGGPESTRFPIARLRYTETTGHWAIYWRDRNLKFHEYQYKRPSKNVQSLLDYIRESKDPIFFG
ncbi:MAG: hypothetical protein JWR35_3915 [Marmoricola sp.]|nr:hypothetical protein [Marmoricola sp.]